MFDHLVKEFPSTPSGALRKVESAGILRSWAQLSLQQGADQVIYREAGISPASEELRRLRPRLPALARLQLRSSKHRLVAVAVCYQLLRIRPVKMVLPRGFVSVWRSGRRGKSDCLCDDYVVRTPVFTGFQYRLLKRIASTEPNFMSGTAYKGQSKLRVTLGDQFFSLIRDKTVIDFGCGEGLECLEMAQNGARKVIGIDIRENLLSQAANNARAAGVEDRCEFVKSTNTMADVIISLDCFEHFADPAGILQSMYDLLSPGGVAMISFGPTWYHPFGGHLFSVFPWAHLIFSEKALIRWRSDIRSDGATRFAEVEGGLNQMTIARFEQLVRRSRFRLEMLETVPIRKLRPLHRKLTREFTTAIVRAKLARDAQAI